MNRKIYVWCPECARLTPANGTPGRFGGMKLSCSSCGTVIRQTRGHAAKRCPDCHSTIHAPLELLSHIPCPCKAPDPKTYAYCGKCGHVAPVTVTRTLLAQRGVCGHCGAKMTLNADNITVCADCGSTIYGQECKSSALFCPCDGMDFMEHAPEFSPQPSPMPAARPAETAEDLRCACGGLLVSRDDAHTCPVCGRSYCADEIRTMTYLATHSHASAPITIAWDTLSAPNRLLYVHPHSGAVPPKSLLIVEENQQAIYRTAGRYNIIPAGHYPIFTDTRTAQERIAAAYSEITDNTILLQLDTRIIFFDNRFHEQQYCAKHPIRLTDNAGALLPRATYELQICDPSALMTHALNFSNDDSVLMDICRRWAGRAIGCVMEERLRTALSDDFLFSAGDPDAQVEAFARRALPADECEAQINRMLSAQCRGVQIRNLTFEGFTCLAESGVPPAKVARCAHCGDPIPDSGEPQLCPHCGRQNRRCDVCGDYRIFDPRRVCTSCGCKDYAC